MKRKGLIVGVGALTLVGLALAGSRAHAAEEPDDVDPDPTEPSEPVEPQSPQEPGLDEPPPADLPSIDDPFGDLPPPPSTPKKPPGHLGRRPGRGTPEPETPSDDTDPTEPPRRPPGHLGRRPRPNEGPPLAELLTDYPRGERFYPVQQDDRFGGTNGSRSIAFRYLLSEAYLAAIEYGQLTPEEARAWASVAARNDKTRARVIDLIQCSGWNDAVYGARPKVGTRASQNGRSILLLPLHAPIVQLLEDGEQPIRNATMAGTPADPSLRHHELLWLPAIDREILWESGGTQLSTSTGDTAWADGSSKDNPPPWVMALGLADNTGDLEGSFGCPGSEGELEV